MSLSPWIFIILFTTTAMAVPLKSYKYNQTKSVSYNEKQFLSNLQNDCKHYGYKRKAKEVSPADILATYPKELSVLYLNKHYRNICYYGVSTALKYLHDDYAAQTEKIIISLVQLCLKDKKNLPVCVGMKSRASFYDLTILLGSFCNKKTLKSFKTVNCAYKKITEQDCKMHQSSNDPLAECPYNFSNESEVKELYKSYFGTHCKRLKWRKPKCLN